MSLAEAAAPPLARPSAMPAPPPAATPEMAIRFNPRSFPGVNWVGLRTLYLKEVRRFWKVGMQTVASPVVTVLLYMLVFVVARPSGQAGAFAMFLAPGLIMMSILNNAFANASSSLIQAKIMGTSRVKKSRTNCARCWQRPSRRSRTARYHRAPCTPLLLSARRPRPDPIS